MKKFIKVAFILLGSFASQAFADFGEWRTFDSPLSMKSAHQPNGFEIYVQNEHGGLCYSIELEGILNWISLLNPVGQGNELSRPCESRTAERSEWENTDPVVANFQTFVEEQGGTVTASIRRRLSIEKVSTGAFWLIEEIEVSVSTWPEIGTFTAQIDKFERRL